MQMITRIQILAIIVAAPALQAQWLNYPTAGVPRLPNGQPNLSAPAPRTADGKPDLSGLWEPATPAAINGSSTFLAGDLPGDRQFSGIGVDVPGGLPLQPWAAELVETCRTGQFKDAPAKVTERFRRPSFGKLEIDITIDDSKAYTKPWSIQVHQDLALDTDLIEFVCLENEKDIPHLVGK